MESQKSKIDATAKHIQKCKYISFPQNLRDCVDVCKRALACVLVHREQQHRAGSVNKPTLKANTKQGKAANIKRKPQIT